MYRGECGVDNLNARLQEALNPAAPGKAEHRLGKRVFRVGDKVMQTRNDYDKMVFKLPLPWMSLTNPGWYGCLVELYTWALAYLKLKMNGLRLSLTFTPRLNRILKVVETLPNLGKLLYSDPEQRARNAEVAKRSTAVDSRS